MWQLNLPKTAGKINCLCAIVSNQKSLYASKPDVSSTAYNFVYCFFDFISLDFPNLFELASEKKNQWNFFVWHPFWWFLSMHVTYFHNFSNVRFSFLLCALECVREVCPSLLLLLLSLSFWPSLDVIHFRIFSLLTNNFFGLICVDLSFSLSVCVHDVLCGYAYTVELVPQLVLTHILVDFLLEFLDSSSLCSCCCFCCFWLNCCSSSFNMLFIHWSSEWISSWKLKAAMASIWLNNQTHSVSQSKSIE